VSVGPGALPAMIQPAAMPIAALSSTIPVKYFHMPAILAVRRGLPLY
jgi:hypothetical protein